MDPETELLPVLSGVSLAQYAAVQAGLAEAIDIAIVLEHEGVDPASWLDADDAWSDKILDDLEHDGPLQQAFDDHLAEARTRYGRRVPPLDERLDAWLDFVRHWSAAAEPIAFLAQLGLRASDVLRLHGTWSTRLALEPALAQEAQEILLREPGEIAVPRPGPRDLDRSPRAPAALKPTVDEVPREDGEPGVFVDFAAWLAGEIPSRTADEVAADAPSAEPPAPDLEVTVLPTTSPLRRAARVAPAADAVRAESPKPPASPLEPPPRVAPPLPTAHAAHAEAASITAPMQAGIFNKSVLPFAPGAPSITEMAPPAPEAKRRRPPVDLGATGVLPSGLLAAALPFMHGPPAAAPAAPDKVDEPRPPPADLGATAMVQQSPFAPAIPFTAPAATPAPAVPMKGPAPTKSVSATGVMPAGLLAAALPFMRTSPPTVEKKVGEKSSLAKRIPGAQSPFANPAPRAPVAVPITPSAPPPASAAVVLTLAQYASLCAELAAFPTATEQTFGRYGLAPVSSRIAVDLAWRERLRRSPDDHREWQKLFQHYEAHFKRAGR
ncbi:MAG: hypothetical protein ABJE95_04085 [Byssovorax sp.]